MTPTDPRREAFRAVADEMVKMTFSTPPHIRYVTDARNELLRLYDEAREDAFTSDEAFHAMECDRIECPICIRAEAKMRRIRDAGLPTANDVRGILAGHEMAAASSTTDKGESNDSR